MTQPSNKELPSFLSFFLQTGFENQLPDHVVPLSGGSINQVYLVRNGTQKIVVKYNRNPEFPGLFEAENDGLKTLAENSDFLMPKHTEAYTFGDTQLLSMEYIESAQEESSTFWETFGLLLAKLHGVSNSFFVYNRDNYFASLVQVNQPSAHWVDFLILRRLEPLVRLNADEGRISKLTIRSVEGLYKQLDSIFPPEPPALLHGDLWSGNFLKSKTGIPSLIDPAVYFGHREMDMAMTLLFGGFNEAFYRSYQESFPLEKDWRKRAGIAQLYPLLFHAYKFGGNYIAEVKKVVADF